MADGSASISGYLKGQTSTTSSLAGYVRGSTNTIGSRTAFVAGGGVVTSSKGGYLKGGVAPNAVVPAYVAGTYDRSAKRHAFLSGIVRSSIPAYMDATLLIPGEEEMAEYNYVWLKTSNLSTQKKFRVLQLGYDDGALEKAESLRRTIGGGIDHSQGAVYRSWNPTIRVRAQETDPDYGTMADLIALYNLNDPGGTPSNVLTFIDNHGISYRVTMAGSFQKSLLGSKIEGVNAWYLVRLRLVEIL